MDLAKSSLSAGDPPSMPRAADVLRSPSDQYNGTNGLDSNTGDSGVSEGGDLSVPVLLWVLLLGKTSRV